MHIPSRGRRAVPVFALAASAALLLSSCSSDSAGDDADGTDGYSIAVLLASSQNGFNQAVADGVQNAIDDLDADIEVTVLDGGFDSDEQLAQMETAGTGDTYDGVVVVPNDGVSLAAAFPLANSIPVAAVLNPIGPDISEMEPQVDGVISTVAVDPAVAATTQAEDVVDYCADLDPCKVALLVGNLSTTLDVTRQTAYTDVLSTHDNIEIVGTVEGQYDPDTSATAIANVLQSSPDLNVVLSNADQQTQGAQIALEDAGIDPSNVYLTGGGGTEYAVQNVRDGVWQADYVNFPVSWGEEALKQVYASLTGGDVESWIDADQAGPVEPYATAETLEETPDFTGEWAG